MNWFKVIIFTSKHFLKKNTLPLSAVKSWFKNLIISIMKYK